MAQGMLPWGFEGVTVVTPGAIPQGNGYRQSYFISYLPFSQLW